MRWPARPRAVTTRPKTSSADAFALLWLFRKPSSKLSSIESAPSSPTDRTCAIAPPAAALRELPAAHAASGAVVAHTNARTLRRHDRKRQHATRRNDRAGSAWQRPALDRPVARRLGACTIGSRRSDRHEARGGSIFLAPDLVPPAWGGCCPCCFESAPIEMHASGELFGLRYLSTSRPALGQLWLSVDTLHSERTWS